MKRPLSVVLIAVLAFAAGVLVSHTYAARLARRDARQIALSSAVANVSSAQITLSLIKQQRVPALQQLQERYLREGVAAAHSAVSQGASLRHEAIPNLAEGFRRATLYLRESGASPDLLLQAEAVLAQLPPAQQVTR
jgi:hypothetical protein